MCHYPARDSGIYCLWCFMNEYKNMEKSRYLIETIPEMELDETFYKHIHSKYPEAHLEQAHTIKEIAKLCPEAAFFMNSSHSSYQPENALDETVLPSESDIGIFRHYRYSPAFLHSHTFFEIIYVLRGTCENIFSSHTISMQAGDICIVAPSIVHAVSAFSDDCIVYNFTIKSQTFETVFLNTLPRYGTLHDFFSRALYSPGSQFYLYFKTGKDLNLFNIFKKILEEYQNKKLYGSSMTNALLTIFFINLLRSHEKNMVVPNPVGRKQENNIIFILKYIEMHYNSLTLPELAAFFNYSERQLTRILKNYTGQTFSSLIQNVRLSRAAELLKQPTLPVTTVMEEIGYSNITHFYRIFEKKFGMTPAEYKNSINQEAVRLI